VGGPAHAVTAIGASLEHLGDAGVTQGLAGGVGHEVLLGHVGDVLALRVLGEQVVEGLVLARPDFLGDRQPPFLGVVEHRIDVEHDAAEGIDAMAHHGAEAELGGSHQGIGCDRSGHGLQNKTPRPGCHRRRAADDGRHARNAQARP
jgi:hypothetical protein